MNYQDRLSKLESLIGEMLVDDNVNDYSKVLIKDIVDIIAELKKDEANCLIDSLITLKERAFCSKNFSDCLDCSNVNECKIIQNTCDLICNNKET